MSKRSAVKSRVENEPAEFNELYQTPAAQVSAEEVAQILLVSNKLTDLQALSDKITNINMQSDQHQVIITMKWLPDQLRDDFLSVLRNALDAAKTAAIIDVNADMAKVLKEYKEQSAS